MKKPLVRPAGGAASRSENGRSRWGELEITPHSRRLTMLRVDMVPNQDGDDRRMGRWRATAELREEPAVRRRSRCCLLRHATVRSLEDCLRSGYQRAESAETSRRRGLTPRKGADSPAREGRPEWERRFQILDAEVLDAAGAVRRGLGLLDAEPGSAEPPDAADVRALVTRAYVLCVSSLGERQLPSGGRRSRRGGPSGGRLQSAALAAEVTLRRGTCASYRGRSHGRRRAFSRGP